MIICVHNYLMFFTYDQKDSSLTSVTDGSETQTEVVRTEEFEFLTEL